MKMRKRETVMIVMIFIAAFAVSLMLMLFAGFASADGPPTFDEFERWFGPAPRGNERTRQLFEATKLLLQEIDKDPRDLEKAAQAIRCKLTADQWQDVLSVAFSYRIWQEIYQVRKDLFMQKPAPGVTKDDLIAEINRLDDSLKTELQKILDGQVQADKKLDEILESLKGLAGKMDSQSIQLKEISNKLDRLLENIRPKGIDPAIFDKMKADYEKKIAELSARIAELEACSPVERKEAPEEIEWSTQEQKRQKNFWFSFNVLEQQRIYTNAFGFVGDSVVYHSWPIVASLVEIGVRKFLISDIGAIQAFAGLGLHKTFASGVGGVIFIPLLDCSLSIGGVFLSENLIGDCAPLQFFGEITFEGSRTRFSVRVVPVFGHMQLNVGVGF